MSESFSVGEIAIWARPNSRYFGDEVQITSPIRSRLVFDNRTQRSRQILCYEIEPLTAWADVGPNVPWVAEPHELRKRRPPQDWVKLCNLTDAPKELEHV